MKIRPDDLTIGIFWGLGKHYGFGIRFVDWIDYSRLKKCRIYLYLLFNFMIKRGEQ